MCGCFCAPYSVPFICVSALCQYHIILITIDLSYVNAWKSRHVIPPSLFFLKTALVVWGIFWFYTNLRIICSVSLKNGIGILIGIALNPDCFG